MYSPLSNKSVNTYDTQINDRLKALRPDREGDLKRASLVLQKIIKRLTQFSPFSNADFQMAGSLKKDTMLTSRNEIDIIISFPNQIRNYPPNEMTRQTFMDFIADEFGVTRRDKKSYLNVILEDFSGYKVDLLPSFKISTEEFLKLSSDEKYIYKPHMSLYHVDFILNRGKKFQDFCRLIKYWAHGPSEQDRDKLTSSFFLELIAADIFDRFGDIKFIQLFEQFLRRLKNIKKRKKRKNKFISFIDFNNPRKDRQDWKDELTILDPMDPEDNIYRKGPQNKQLGLLVTRARNSLKLWDEKSFGEVFKLYFNRQPL